MTRSTRILVSIKATYCIGQSTYDCEILDLSMEGLRIGTRQILAKGDLLKICLTLDDKQIVFFCNVKNFGDSGGEYGLRIEELHPDDKVVLDDFLLRYMLSSNLKPTEEIHL